MGTFNSFGCGFQMNATPGLHCNSWGSASATQRLRFGFTLKPLPLCADRLIQENGKPHGLPE
jgi:hypothetical protein